MASEIGDDDAVDSNDTGQVRYPCMPSMVALQQMKTRLALAKLGKKLMKWMSLALRRELMIVSSKIITALEHMGEDMREAFIVLARCRYFSPHVNPMVLMNIDTVAHQKLVTTFNPVCTVKVFAYEVVKIGPRAYEHLCIAKGGLAIQKARDSWEDLVKKLVGILEWRTAFIILEEGYMGARKKTNVLSKIVIPRLNATIHYINAELEEIAREEFYRMKKIIQVKNKLKQKDKKTKAKVVETPPPKTHSKCPYHSPHKHSTEPLSIRPADSKLPSKVSKPTKKPAEPKVICKPEAKSVCEPEVEEFVTSEPQQNNSPELHEVYARKPDLPSRNSSDQLGPGITVTDVREITRVVRTLNEDGTVKEERKKIVIKKQTKSPYPPSDSESCQPSSSRHSSHSNISSSSSSDSKNNKYKKK